MERFASKWTLFPSAMLVMGLAATAGRAQMGPILNSTGAVNQSFAGVATAAPLSAGGALLWNPATMPGLDRSEMEVGACLLIPDTHLSSRIPANAFGPGAPPVGLSGDQETQSSVFALPTIGLVYLPENSSWSFGLGVFVVAGFGVDYPASLTNPLTTAPPPNGLGFGPIFSSFEVVQIAPSMAYQITDRISVGGGPLVDLGFLQLTPGIMSAPDAIGGAYPPGTDTRTVWGAGFIVGAYYKGDGWGAGTSFKSPQWLDTFRFNTVDALGQPHDVHLNVDLPLTVSVGAAYTGWEHWLLAADVRYLDYRDTNGFGESGFAPDGSLRGIGYRSIFEVALGAQYQLSKNVSLRLGYSWNQDPIGSTQAGVNVATPLVIEHDVYAGASWKVTEDFSLSLAYQHGFHNSVTGPVITPLGSVPGSAASISAAGDMVTLGATIKFGASRTPPTPVSSTGDSLSAGAN